jgi:hypothetical protein
VSYRFDLGDLVDVAPFYHGEEEKRRLVVPGFRGEVTRRFMNGSNQPCYNVRDLKTGRAWHRDEHELSAAKIVLPNAFTRCINYIALVALMCRKHKQEEVAALDLHPWNRHETALQSEQTEAA